MSQAQLKWGKVVAKAWMDEAFKTTLLANPTEVLKEHGIEVNEGVVLNFPSRPAATELVHEELKAANALNICCASGGSCAGASGEDGN